MYHSLVLPLYLKGSKIVGESYFLLSESSKMHQRENKNKENWEKEKEILGLVTLEKKANRMPFEYLLSP